MKSSTMDGIKVHLRGIWLAQMVHHETLDLRVVRSSPMLAASVQLEGFPLKSHFSLLHPNLKLEVETSLQRSYETFLRAVVLNWGSFCALLPHQAHLPASEDIFDGHDLGEGFPVSSTRQR